MQNWPINRNWVTGRAVVDKVPMHVHDLLSPEGDQFPQTRETLQQQGHRMVGVSFGPENQLVILGNWFDHWEGSIQVRELSTLRHYSSSQCCCLVAPRNADLKICGIAVPFRNASRQAVS
jgi:hypothetical protein